jgi:glycosyltransferase involved in cell wall biosynthesis/SAM-dependent methyltransferase
MRIAYFSPLNPKPSGISDYSEALLPHLAGRVERLDVFIEDYTPSARFCLPNLRIRPWQEFEPEYKAGNYDVVLYHIGNNPFHVYIYDLALRIPGVVVLHEFNLHYLVAHATLARQDWEGYFREVEHDAGTAALEQARQAQAGLQQPDYDGVALSRRLLGRSRAGIVHSEYMVRRVREAGHRLPLRRIPHGVDVPVVDSDAARRYLSEKTGLPLDDSIRVFGIFGFLKPYKRIYEALRAFARLRKEHPEVRMVLVGEEHPHYPLRPLIRELGLEDVVRILGHVPIETFTKLLAAADFCINLRRPTAGETSGSFLRALALGKPALVSEIGSFLELPDEVAFKIPVDEKEVEWLYEYMKTLLENPNLARAVGECGRAYVEHECLWPRVAGLYVEFMEECARNRPEPAEAETRARGVVSSPKAAQQTPPLAGELQEYIVGFSHGSKLMEEYVQTHLARLVRTVQITPTGGNGDRALELGCYLQITPALRRYLGYGEVRGAYYGEAGKTDIRSTTSITGETFSCTMDLFDAERDPFPYPDGHFRAVLCCELIEHLTTDPMHMLAEINRVVAEGGYLVLTTPNIAGLRSLHAVLNGYHPALFPSYIRPSSDGTVDPRHSREYTPIEIAQLVEAAGFHVEHLETGDYNEQAPNYEEARRVLEANRLSTALRGEVIFCRARKMGPLRHRWPKELYYPP